MTISGDGSLSDSYVGSAPFLGSGDGHDYRATQTGVLTGHIVGSSGTFTATIDDPTAASMVLFKDGTPFGPGRVASLSTWRYSCSAGHLTMIGIGPSSGVVSVLSGQAISPASHGTLDAVLSFGMVPTVTFGSNLVPANFGGVGFEGTVAIIADSDPAAATKYSASIDWGDGTIGAGKITPGTPAGAASVVGSHTYWEAGSHTVTVLVTRVASAGGGTGSTAGSVLVKSRYVGLGDSYSAGEGSNFPVPAACRDPAYLDQAGNPTDTDQLVGAMKSGILTPTLGPCTVPSGATGDVCHRSTTAYAHLVSSDLGVPGMTLDFAACSGAQIEDFYHPFDDRTTDKWHNGETAQLDHLGSDVSLVTLTVGGNNIDFAGVAKDCVTSTLNPIDGVRACLKNDNTIICKLLFGPGPACSARQAVTDALSVHEKWIQLLRQIRAKAPGARILVLGYPRFFRLAGIGPACEYFTQLEQRWIDDRIKLVNDALRDAVEQSGVANYVDVFDAFDGKEECTASPDMTGVNLVGANWGTPENLHPNPAGHRDEAPLVEFEYWGETGTLTGGVPWTVGPGQSKSFRLAPAAGNRRETIAVATRAGGGPSTVPAISLTDESGHTVTPALGTDAETVWDIAAPPGRYTLHLDNTRSTSSITANVQSWLSQVPRVVGAPIMMPIGGPRPCPGSQSAPCMDVVIVQPPSAFPALSYVLYNGADSQQFASIGTAPGRQIVPVPCLTDAVLQASGLNGTHPSYVATGILNCATTQASLRVGSHAVPAGRSVALSGGGFAPNAPVAAILSSRPIVLGTRTADGSGDVRWTVAIPSNVVAGAHTVEVSGLSADGTVLRLVGSLKVVPPVNGGPGWALVTAVAGAAGVAVCALVMLVAIRRRRRPR